ncbi:MAG TPA: ABC transporter permease, partial [Firmicutes bacterium]|nr:ABC transporter permease [Bacillota bacterium]
MENEKKRNKLKRLLAKRGMGQVITVTIGLVALVIVFGFLNPYFLTGRNISNLLRQIAP